MNRTPAKRRCGCGIGIVEVVVATLMVGIACAGVLSYEYYAARQLRMAQAYTGAVRIGYLLLEDWKANGGSLLYAGGVRGIHNPTELNMGFEKIDSGVYKISIDNISMQITLSRPVIYQRLIPLSITVQWRNDFLDGNIRYNDHSVNLTTNARVDQVGG